MSTCTSSDADALITALRTALDVHYVPMHNIVARLDTTRPEWVLYLDSDSPLEDHCWAMVDALRVLTLGLPAAESATHVAQLSVVRE